MTHCFVYITADSRDDAESMARTLVEERLAACANILGGIRSFYWWDGAVQSGDEQAIVAKTRQELVPRIVERIKALHGYSCPCVVALPVVAGNPGFLAWIDEETAASG
jgi:periplasmic divalent cation tolerance protein